MPCAHSLVPVGMMTVQTRGYKDIPNDNLYYDLERIYKGDINYSNYEACNAVHAYQEYFYYPAANKAQRAIDQYADLVQKAAAASGNRLKCLVGDLTQKGNFSGGTRIDYFYDGPEGGAIVNTCNVRAFVNGFIDIINTVPGLADNVLGWYLADEPFWFDGTAKKPSLDEFAEICKAAHETQSARGWNKPFYVVFYMNGIWMPNWNDIDFSRIDPWVKKVTESPQPGGGGGAGADIVIMIDYYPWSELAVEGNFFLHQSPSVESKRSPLRKWRKFIYDTTGLYGDNPKVLGVQAVVQAQGALDTEHPWLVGDPFRIPGHADMHQQLRAVINFMNESKPPRPEWKSGVWLYAWGRGADYTPPPGNNANDAFACKRWTQSGTERWAEAVQNEIDNQVEGIAEAIPDDNTAVQVIPNAFLPRVDQEGGSWVTFRMKDRGKVRFIIKDTDNDVKRQLHWEYAWYDWEHGVYVDFESVKQKAVNTVSLSPGQVDKLGATAIFFDGKHDCGNSLQGEYTCQMLLNNNPVGNTLYLYVDWWVVRMHYGWNLMSFPAIKCYYEGTAPTDQPTCVQLVDIATLGFNHLADWFSAIMDPHDGWEFVMGDNGAMDRTLPYELHSLKYMSPCSGYWVDTNVGLSNLATLHSNGQLFNPCCAISLQQGWNKVGYPLMTVGYYDCASPPVPGSPDYAPVPEGTEWVKVDPPVAAYVFASIAGKYDFIIGEHGVYDPDLPSINTLHFVAPGDAYDIDMTEAAELVYSQMGLGTGSPGMGAPSGRIVRRFGSIPTRPVALVYGSLTHAGTGVDAGSLVQVFSQSGLLCGQINVMHKGYYGLMLVYGDNGLTPYINGARYREKLTFRVNGKPAHTERVVYWIGDKTVQRVDLII